MRCIKNTMNKIKIRKVLTISEQTTHNPFNILFIQLKVVWFLKNFNFAKKKDTLSSLKLISFMFFKVHDQFFFFLFWNDGLAAFRYRYCVRNRKVSLKILYQQRWAVLPGKKNMTHSASHNDHGEKSGYCGSPLRGSLCFQWVQSHCLPAQGSF